MFEAIKCMIVVHSVSFRSLYFSAPLQVSIHNKVVEVDLVRLILHKPSHFVDMTNKMSSFGKHITCILLHVWNESY